MYDILFSLLHSEDLMPILQSYPRAEGRKMPIQIGYGVEERHIDVCSQKQREIFIQFELRAWGKFERKLEFRGMRQRAGSEWNLSCSSAPARRLETCIVIECCRVKNFCGFSIIRREENV